MEKYTKNKTLSIAIVLIIFGIMLSSIAGVVQANTDPWWSDAFYSARTIDGFPFSAYVKGQTILLELENEQENYQTIYTKRVAKIKNLNTGKVVKDYTVLSSKKAIPFGDLYSTNWVPKKAGKYVAYAEVFNKKNNKKVIHTQTFNVYDKPIAKLSIFTYGKTYKIGESIPFGIEGVGTLPLYLEPSYNIINVDTGTTYTFEFEGFDEEMPGGSGQARGYEWDQKDKDGNQVAKGKYKIRWYWSDKPSPAIKNKYTDSGKFKIT
jgi:hypothetical protein